MDQGLTRYTQLVNPASTDRAFDPNYLRIFFQKFGYIFDGIKRPSERNNAEYVSFGLVMTADRINYLKERGFPLFPILKTGALKLDGIYPSTSFICDLGWNERHMRMLAFKTNYSVSEEFGGSPIGHEELVNLLDSRFTVERCIEHCIEAAKESVSLPYCREGMGVR